MYIKNLASEMIQWRREFHQIPELAFEEFKTSEKIKAYLTEMGIKQVEECISTGVVAVIYGKHPGKTVAIRVDIDGLPVMEENDVPYRSTHPGKMHACGHDAHIAIGLGLAKVFHENRNSLCGNVKIIFQPAEEGTGGAKPMIQAGVLKNPDVDFVLGCHVWPELPSKSIDITEGTCFASSDRFNLRINGMGGHGAMPEKINDCIYAGAKVVNALKELYLSQPYEKRTIISICSFEAPSVHNVYPSSCMLKGTIRTLSAEIRSRVFQDIKDIVKEILDELHIPFDLFIEPEYPVAVNDKRLAALMKECAKELFPKQQILDCGSTMGAEDFAYFSQADPSCHVKVGWGNESCCKPLHNPRFQLDEDAIVTAGELLEKMTLTLMTKDLQ